MKILFICDNFPPHTGGAEVLFKNLAESLVHAGHEVTVLTRKLESAPGDETVNGVKIVRVSSFDSRYIFSFSAIIRAIRLARMHDLIQTTTFNAALPAWIASRVARKPSVITVLEVWLDKWNIITGFGRLKSRVYRQLEKLIYRLPFDRYVCISKATMRDLRSTGVSNERARQVYPGIDHNFWNRDTLDRARIMEVRSALRGGDDSVKIYFAWGRPGVSKGFESLLRAARIISAEHRARLVLMIGEDKSYRKNYRELTGLTDSLGLQDHVEILKPADYDSLRYYISASDLIVIPSLAEGFGYAAVEASALQMPLLISDAGSLPEVVSGRYMIYERNNPQDLAEKAGLFFKRKITLPKTETKYFHRETSVQGYLDCYTELLQQAG